MVIHLIFIGIFLSISSLGAESFKTLKKVKQTTMVLSKKSVTSKGKITGLYVAYFNRAADKKGLEFWEDKSQTALSKGDNVSDVLKELSAGFAEHPTFISTYKSMSNREFVEAIYKNTLGKAGDEEGIGHWTDYLDGKSRSEMVSDFVEASLTLDLTPENFPTLTAQELAVAQERQNLITNKVEVALSFTTLLGTHTNVADAQNPESDPAYQASIEILSDIVDDNTSVSTAIDFLESIKDDDDPIDRINHPTPTGTVIKGYLIDSPLQGVTYLCDGKEALTNASGIFECINPPVTFKIGKLTLGTLTAFTADGKVYPQDILGLPRNNFTTPKLKLLARLLQSLDDDGVISTSIKIEQSVRDAFDVEQKFEDLSENDVKALVEGLGKRFVTEIEAVNHLKKGLGVAITTPPSSSGGGGSVAPVVTPTPTPISMINKTHQKSFSYDSTNRVVKEDLGDGNYIEYVYDDSGNLISQTVVK